MTRRSRSLLAGLLLATALPWSQTSAEVRATSRNGYHTDTLLMGITDGVDPIPFALWEPVSLALELSPTILNPEGWLRPDGRPHVQVHPIVGWPIAVWSINAAEGTDPDRWDVVAALWQSDHWGEFHIIADDPELDELDPRVFVEENDTSHIVWWVDDLDTRVMLRTHLPNGAWNAPIRISPYGEVARRPTVARIDDGRMRVAYERHDPLGGLAPTELVVLWMFAPGSNVVEVVLESGWLGPLEPQFHYFDGQLWLDWRSDYDQFAMIQLVDGEWTEPMYFEWTDHSWLGDETVRKLISDHIRGLPSADALLPVQTFP